MAYVDGKKHEARVIRLMIVAGPHSAKDGLWMRLSAEPDLTVVDDAPDCVTALDAAECHLPDVTLVDMDIVRASDVASMVGFRTLCRMTPVIVLTLHDDVYARRAIERTSAAALVDKLAPVETLLATIRQVALTGVV
jgi:DNA-binding NarL/FixJ family response regulator